MIVKVQFEMTNLPEATDEQIQNWLDFELGYTGFLPGGNPLAREALCANRPAYFQVSERSKNHDHQ